MTEVLGIRVRLFPRPIFGTVNEFSANLRFLWKFLWCRQLTFNQNLKFYFFTRALNQQRSNSHKNERECVARFELLTGPL